MTASVALSVNSLAPPGSPLARSAAPVYGFSPLGAPRRPRTRPPRARRSATRRRAVPPRGATAGRTARDPATPAHGACHDRNPPHEAHCRPSHRDDLAKLRHWSARRLRQSDSAHHGPRCEAGGASIIPPDATAPLDAPCRRASIKPGDRSGGPRRAVPPRQNRCRWCGAPPRSARRSMLATCPSTRRAAPPEPMPVARSAVRPSTAFNGCRIKRTSPLDFLAKFRSRFVTVFIVQC
jgi:hypothetical protein